MRWRTLDDEPAGVERIRARRNPGAGIRMLHGARWRSCGRKQRFPSEHVADRYARKAGARYGCTMRVYGCGLCGGWHMTSANDRRA